MLAFPQILGVRRLLENLLRIFHKFHARQDWFDFGFLQDKIVRNFLRINVTNKLLCTKVLQVLF